MIEINQEALTELAKYAATFYIWMEAFMKPAMKVGLQRYRKQFVKEPVGDQAQLEQDELYTARLNSSFRVVTILMGITLVWGYDIGVSFFDVFGHSPETANQELLNWITTGAAIGLGSRGTHFLVDVVEDVLRFSMTRLSPNEPKAV